MWEPRHLTTLWAFTASYRNSFFYVVLLGAHLVISIKVFYFKFLLQFSHNLISVNQLIDFTKHIAACPLKAGIV
jgi:hypothetical protein